MNDGRRLLLGLGMPWVVAWALTVSRPSAAETPLEAAFSRASTVWTCSPDNIHPPEYIANGEVAGCRYTCDFSRVEPGYPRCLWDTVFAPADLRGAAAFTLRLHVRNAEQVWRVSFMLKSGGGWYFLKEASALTEGWNQVVLDREEGVTSEGTPAGWDKVDGLRFNVFAAGKGSAVLTIADARASAAKVPVPPPPLFTVPREDRGLKREGRRDVGGRLLETRMINDETGAFLIEQDRLLDRIGRAGFNAFMPCVWNGGWAMYRSSTTPVMPGFAPRFDGGRDPLAELIARAHARGIEVHAWFKISYRGEPDGHPEFPTEGVPQGAYDLHDPAFREFIVKEVQEFARRYEVDGVVLDYVRTQGISYSDSAREAYRQRFGADLDETKSPASAQAQRRLLELQRDAVSDVVRRAREALRAAKPKAILSVCGHPLPKPTLDIEGRNEWLWLERDDIDIAYAMEYDWRPNFRGFSEARASSPRPRQHVLMLGNYEIGKRGEVEPRAAEQVARLLDYALRKFPGNGVGLYWYRSLDDAQIEALRHGPFKEKAVPYWAVR